MDIQHFLKYSAFFTLDTKKGPGNKFSFSYVYLKYLILDLLNLKVADIVFASSACSTSNSEYL